MLVLSILCLSVFINSLALWILLNKSIGIREMIRLTCIAIALNKLLLTGSGYVLLSLKLKRDEVPVYKTISAFIILELFSISPWLILGFYFGAKVFLKIPVIFIAILWLLLIFIIIEKNKIINFFKKVIGYFKEIRLNFFIIVPLVLLNVLLGFAYYFLLFKSFGFFFNRLDVLRIVSVAITVGYLSPAPAGLGFKESSMVFLLIHQGFSLKNSISFTIADRIISTAFYLALGFLFGAETIINEIKTRLNYARKLPRAR